LQTQGCLPSPLQLVYEKTLPLPPWGWWCRRRRRQLLVLFQSKGSLLLFQGWMTRHTAAFFFQFSIEDRTLRLGSGTVWTYIFFLSFFLFFLSLFF
jgi:hypothetical protein